MPGPCEHPRLREEVKAYGHWHWERDEDGVYSPVGEIEVGEEESEFFQCEDCGEYVSLNDDCQIEEDE